MSSSPESTPRKDTRRPQDPDSLDRLPGLREIEAAARRLAGTAVVTPLLEAPALSRAAGGRVLIKPETLQRTGSFKFRGAYNRISQLDAAGRAAGIITYSSGNHAQGVAAAAALCGVQATIVMPSDAPAIKIANTRDHGAEVRLYDRATESREALAADLARRRGATLIKPYDDPEVIAGQGTCGLELAQQAAARGASIDAVLVPCGGGGLIAGIATALGELSPGTAVYAVEPEGFDDTARSLAAGDRLSNDPSHRSFCDALLAPSPGEITFAINRRRLTGGLAVSDREVAQAMAFAFRSLKLVVEPGGAVALAALLCGRIETRERTIAVVLSGGNVDPQTYQAAIAAA